jgi:hypothetical protein
MDTPPPNVVEWLLDSDPAIRWQVMRDLTDSPAEVVATERARVATEGWGARLLALQGDDGYWAGGAHFPASFSWSEAERGPDGRLMAQPWTATSWSLFLLKIFGLPPDSTEARRAVQLVRVNVVWEYDDLPFFDGETDACINGRAVGVGTYFGEDVSGIVERLLNEQMDDGGWNCEQENGSTRGSFHTTISVLEGLLEYETHSIPDAAVAAARHAGEEYLLDRHLLRRLSNGETPDQRWTLFSFPYWWRYDVLRGLDYLRAADAEPDERTRDALSLVEAHRGVDGRWPRQNVIPGDVHFDVDGPEGSPSKWNTLRALRVLDWAHRTPAPA